MSKRPADSSRRPPARVVALLVGFALGAVWGSVMWVVFEATGQDSGARGWAYLAITTAMIGAGVAAIFGTVGARKRGERIGPRSPFGRRGRDG